MITPPPKRPHFIESLWLLAAIAIPLTFNPWGSNAFELPKAMLLRALVLLMGLGVVFKVISGDALFPRGQRLPPLLWPALVLGLITAAATLLSANPRASLWGSYERQQGWLTQCAYIALFCICATQLRTRAKCTRLWRALVWGSAPVVIYGLLQAAGLDPLAWQTDASSNVLASIGRANFLGSYLVLLLPLTAGRIPLARQRTPLYILLGAQALCLLLTQARGAWLGGTAAAVTFGMLWASVTRKRRLILGIAIAAILLTAFVVLLNIPQSPLAQLPGLQRLASLADTQSGSGAARITIWRTALPLIQAQPWLGYGPETLSTVFLHVYPPQLVYYHGRDFIVDRAHNLWLDLALSAGLLSVLAFIGLLLIFGMQARRGLQNSRPRWQCIAWCSLSAAVIGHLLDQQFSFALTSSATVFWLLLAFAAALNTQSHLSTTASPPTHTITLQNQLILLPPAALTGLLIIFVCLRPLLADSAHAHSRAAHLTKAQSSATAALAVRQWPLEPIYRLGLASALAQQGDYHGAVAQSQAARQLDPDDAWLWVAAGDLHMGAGQNAPSRYTQAEHAYRQALSLGPTVAIFHRRLGLALAQQGRLEAAIAALERAVDLDASDHASISDLKELYQLSAP